MGAFGQCLRTVALSTDGSNVREHLFQRLCGYPQTEPMDYAVLTHNLK
jgi:hypothetical protein